MHEVHDGKHSRGKMEPGVLTRLESDHSVLCTTKAAITNMLHSPKYVSKSSLNKLNHLFSFSISGMHERKEDFNKLCVCVCVIKENLVSLYDRFHTWGHCVWGVCAYLCACARVCARLGGVCSPSVSPPQKTVPWKSEHLPPLSNRMGHTCTGAVAAHGWLCAALANVAGGVSEQPPWKHWEMMSPQ